MWIRRVQVIVTNANDASKKTVFEKHAIEYDIRSIIGWGADTATINIYNLAVEEVKALQNKTFGQLLIEVRAGYADELQGGTFQNKDYVQQTGGTRIQIDDGAVLPTIFSGVIKNAIGYKRPPEHVTTIFCVSKAAVNASIFTQMKAIPPGATLREAIKSMCADYGFNTISTYGIPDADLNVVLPTGRVFHDTFIREFTDLLSEHNMQCYIATAEVQIFSETYGDPDAISRMAKGREPIKLDANYVQGNPMAGIGTLDVDLFMRPDIQPGMVIDVSPLLGKELLANGVVSVTNQQQVLNLDDSVFRYAMEDKYLIESVIQRGGTHTRQPLTTSIRAVLGGNSAMGLDESDWQNLYLMSGMSLESEGFD